MKQFTLVECLSLWGEVVSSDSGESQNVMRHQFVATAVNPNAVALVQPHPTGAPLAHPEVTGQVSLINGQTFAVRGDISALIAALESDQ